MADQISLISAIDPQADPYGYLGFIRNPDGSITRQESAEPTTAISSYDGSPLLLVKDIPVNQSKSTWVRVFHPKEAIESSHAGKKLPLLIFIHGGGFVIASLNTPTFDDFYSTFTTDIPAVLVSIEYRRGPEHRLPAAYDDCMEALHLIKNSHDKWLTKYADFSNSFVMGSSAGSNLAYHVALRASSHAHDLKPLKIKGVILHQPFLGGTKRTESELKNIDDKILPLPISDIMWELALPAGADRDHEFSNPAMNIKLGQFDHIKALGWKILVTGYQGDVMFDRQTELVKILEDNSVDAVAKFEQGGYHGNESTDLDRLKSLCEVVKEFVKFNCN